MEPTPKRFTAPNLIGFSSRSVASRTRVARVTVEGITHVAFGLERGQSPTNEIERLAAFIWETCYPEQVWSAFRWYDVQFPSYDLLRRDNADPRTAPFEDLFRVCPVRLTGRVVPRRDWLGRVRGREFAVFDPAWERDVSCQDLVPQFRRALVRDVLEPLRDRGVGV